MAGSKDRVDASRSLENIRSGMILRKFPTILGARLAGCVSSAPGPESAWLYYCNVSVVSDA